MFIVFNRKFGNLEKNIEKTNTIIPTLKDEH